MAPAPARSVVVTGASRGLGLEFVKQLLERGDTVVAAARSPQKSPGLQTLAAQYPHTLKSVALDVLDPACVAAAASKISEELGHVDVLINNAGVSGELAPAAKTDPETFKDVLLTNVVGPFRVTEALLPRIKKGTKKQVVQISSALGSNAITQGFVASNTGPFSAMSHNMFAYKISKSALNMETVALAADLKAEGVTVIAVHPGWVATDMGNQPAGLEGTGPDLEAPASIAAQLKVIDALSLEQSGAFLSYNGDVLPW